jgi:2-dehydro-3-deoxyphosphogluconate aldolase/(4S)-4-hydroxy-2-oxoglutarate aldolase
LNASQRLYDLLRQKRLIALFTPTDAATAISVYETLAPLGVTLEIALRAPGALDTIAAIRDRHPDALLLAGTVLTAAQAEQAVAAGAAGLVSPDYLAPVVQVGVAHDVMCIPGGLGDVGKQLVQKAEAYGCSPDELRRQHPHQWAHKLFPACAGGTTFAGLAAAWRAIFPDLLIVHTGGVSAERLPELLALDPHGVFCGSALTAKATDPVTLAAEAQRWLSIIHAPRQQPSERAPTTNQHSRFDKGHL